MLLHEGQQRVIEAARRFNVVACGRRFGKTTMGLALAYYGAPFAPGGLSQRFDVGWFASQYKYLDEAWRAAKGFLRPMIARIDSQMHRIELHNGAALDFWTLVDPDAGRGRKYGLAIVDEASKAPNLELAWTEAIRPTLTDYAGGAWFFSTPKGRNYFWQLYVGAEKPPQGTWAAHHAPSAANPYLPHAEIEAARLELPERVFAQEYLAAFLEDGAGVFRGLSQIPACAWLDKAEPGQGYTIGVDWGRHEDFTVFAVLDAALRLVHVDRFTGVGYELQTGRLKALWERFGKCPILAESNSMGGPLIERLQRERVAVRAFHTSNASKAEAVESLALAIEGGRMAFADDPRLQPVRDELLAFEQERLASGLIRYAAPPGGHDDCVIALAIAHHGAAVPAVPAALRVAAL